jgi:alpha-glucosidase
LYISIPYLIIEQRGFYVGVLVNNPFAVFMATNPDLMIAEQNAADEKPDDDFYLGAPDGAPSLYVLVGPSLAALTRKLQRLCGTVPRPPLWALGHHQSRWGYRSADELEKLADRLQAEQFPCSALWLDIDYMRGYRVFSWHPDYFKHVRADLARISKRGYRVLPIIDPGVKIDPQYAVYCDGLKKDVFCRNSAGTPYTGFVWPGATAFPDFSLPRVREWWAEKVARFARDGIQGVWIDMNDPSTGASDADEMRFNHGKNAHATYHNQYALGMAAATREGLQRAHPEQRPFVLSRSGFISMSRFAAVWNGDNFSNEHHLQQSIPMSLNLALSGLPFNGPDVPGFCGNADGPLLSLWYRAGFLFPFFRNHAAWDSARQEPWAFGKSYLRVARHYTRLRYKLLPYMYNLFIAQEERGEAIMRPMLYDFRSTRKLPLEHTADQFMLGPYLLHAPLLQRDARQREVTLPHGMWFDAMCGRWIKGGRRIRVTVAKEATPIFVRDGAVIPMQRGRPKNGEVDMAAIEMHVFLSPRFRGEASVRYRFDDGETTAYQQGAETDVTFRLLGRGNVLDIKIDEARMDYRPCQVRWVMYRHVESVRLNRNGKMQKLRVRPYQWRFSGRALSGLQAE